MDSSEDASFSSSSCEEIEVARAATTVGEALMVAADPASMVIAKGRHGGCDRASEADDEDEDSDVEAVEIGVRCDALAATATGKSLVAAADPMSMVIANGRHGGCDRADDADDDEKEDCNVEAVEVEARCDAGDATVPESAPTSAAAPVENSDSTVRLEVPEQRKDITDLSGVLRLCRSSSSIGPVCDGASGETQATEAVKWLLYSCAKAAVGRANEVRSRHRHCQSGPPLALSCSLVQAACRQANWLAEQEDTVGLTDELLEMLRGHELRDTLRSVNGHEKTRHCGLAMCRLESWDDLQGLAQESVNCWYKAGEFYPYDKPRGQPCELQFWRFVQLLDPACQLMGWGAAASGYSGAAYVVAVFDHVGPVYLDSVDALQPAAAAAPAAAPAPLAKWLTERLSSDECITVGEWLQGVRALRSAARSSTAPPPPRQPRKEWNTAASYFVFAGADAAARRTNQLRGRHPHCWDRPLTVSSRLVQLANKLADELAVQEERRRVVCSEATMQVEQSSRQHLSTTLGLAVCRVVTSDFKTLPETVVNCWYNEGESYPYDSWESQEDSSSPMQDAARHRRFVQLLDPGSRCMGWGAALAVSSGAVYAVALFDRCAGGDPRWPELLLPPVLWAPGHRAAPEFDFNELGSVDSGMLGRLGAVRRLLAIVQPPQEEPEEDDTAPAWEMELASRLETAAELAVERANHLRWRYRHCQNVPLALNLHLCGLAACRAHELATHEDRHGLTRELQAALQDSAMAFPGAGQRLGYAACRLAQCPEPPVASVDFWYKRGYQTYPFGKPETAVHEAKYRHFTQLVDPNSRHMGWAAAVAASSGAVFAVALFNSVGSTNRRCLERMRQAERRDSDAVLEEDY